MGEDVSGATTFLTAEEEMLYALDASFDTRKKEQDVLIQTEDTEGGSEVDLLDPEAERQSLLQKMEVLNKMLSRVADEESEQLAVNGNRGFEEVRNTNKAVDKKREIPPTLLARVRDLATRSAKRSQAPEVRTSRSRFRGD
eukprot:jgi/Pico_ML_1/51153/g2235.t1